MDSLHKAGKAVTLFRFINKDEREYKIPGKSLLNNKK